MYEQLKGQGLIAFSDPAGAKVGLALAYILQKMYYSTPLVVSNRYHEFYKSWDIKVNLIDNPIVLDSLAVKPEWVFTATSHPDSSGCFELKILSEIRGDNIPTWSFVDHWSNFALRFRMGNDWILPDNIIVIDEYARAKAIEEGLPEGKIRIKTNPYLAFISQYWTPTFSKEEILRKIGIGEKNGGLVLYAPDPISLRNESKEYAFDEISVFQELVDIINHFQNLKLIVKLHPLQPREHIINLISKDGNDRLYLVDNIDNLELINSVDMVVGFYSNFMIEANEFEKVNIIRYFPMEGGKDLIEHLNIGTKITDKIKLFNEFKTLSNSK